MPKFSNASKKKLATCHPLLQEIMNKAIQEVDFVVICGERTVVEQQELYAQGRTKAGSIVTKIDGITKKSKHNYLPSLAVDIAPYKNGKIDWNDLAAFKDLAKIIKRIAFEECIELRWGGEFKGFVDMPHYELA